MQMQSVRQLEQLMQMVSWQFMVELLSRLMQKILELELYLL